MAAPYLQLDLKAEAAFQTVIRAALAALEVAVPNSTYITSANVVTAFNSDQETITEDHCVIRAMGSQEDGHRSGNERMIVSVKVMTSPFVLNSGDTAGGPRTRHSKSCGQVFDSIKTTTLATDLSAAAADFRVFDSIQFKRTMNAIKDTFGNMPKGEGARWFTSEIVVEFSCAPSDIV